MIRLLWVVTLSIGMGGMAYGRDGVSHGGGGDLAALEFTGYGKSIAEMLNRVREFSQTVPEVDPKNFAQAVADTKVESEESLRLHGVSVDAINYPAESRIVVNRSRWAPTDVRAPQIFALVFHEYLGILRIDDSGYRLSTRVATWIEEKGLPRFPRSDDEDSSIECANQEKGRWSFGRSGLGCDSRSHIPDSLVYRTYGNLIFYSDEPDAREVSRYLQALVPAVNDAAEFYLRERRAAEPAEVKAWQALVAAVVQTESSWSHFRLGRDGRLKISRTDGGHGWGLMAVDDRYHQPNDVIDPIKGLGYGMDILFTAWEKAAKASCVPDKTDWRARSRSAYSAFNGGSLKICRWAGSSPYGRNDQAFATNLDIKPWLSHLKDPNQKSSLDIPCLLRGGAVACTE